ncbi:hypothetical protein [Streptomyces sp. NPDC045251]|uniref:hypothetical protein n=1 Tax=unclassified Streptomyces TaxID=2593676 RepID=UPI0033FF7FBB
MARKLTWLAVLVLAASAVAMAEMGAISAAARFCSGVVLLVFVARMRVPPVYEAAFSVSVTGAFWCDVGHWYHRVPHLDTVVHFLLTGTGSVVAFCVLLRFAGPTMSRATVSFPRWTPAVLVGMAGTSAAVLWELYEWVVEQIAPGSMRVGYGDTITDLAVGVTGSLLAGALFSAQTCDP